MLLTLGLCSTGFTARLTLSRPPLDAISIGVEVDTLSCHTTTGRWTSPPVMSFDASAYEEDRLARDAEAMAAMAVEEAKAAEDAKYAVLRNPWKWVIRRRIWDLMEAEDYACQPRPVHHRIPNFVDAERAAARLARLSEFERAAMVKVNPDTPQRSVRRLVLSQGKVLLTPQPRLRTGFFSTLSVADNLRPGDQHDALTNSKGVAQHGTQV